MADRDRLFRQVVGGIDDPKKFISGWFKGARLEDVYRENVAEWLLWAFFNKHSRDEYFSDSDDATSLEVESFVERFEQETGIVAHPGYNPNVSCIRLNSDPVKTIHRPAMVYLVNPLILRYHEC